MNINDASTASADPNVEQGMDLKKSYKPSWVFAMALGAAIGWGAFILPFDWMQTGGLGGTLIGFLIGGASIGIIALSYGYIIRALPVTGGGVAYALAALGKKHAFIAGWSLTLGYAGCVALNASAVTLAFRVTAPDWFMRIPLYEIAGWTIYLPEVFIASAFILAFAWINIQGTALSGRFQFISVMFLICSVGIITISMLVYYVIEQPELAPAFPTDSSPWLAILTIVAFAPWAYIGFDSIPQLAGEFDFSPRKALKLLMWGVITATAVYLAMMISTTIAVGVNHADFENEGWPPAIAISEVMGPFGLILMLVSVFAGVLTGLNGFFTAASRVLFTLGKTGLIPRRFALVHEAKDTPYIAIAFTAIICLISPWFGRAALTWVVDMTSVGITIAYFYTCYACWKISRHGQIPGMTKSLASSRRWQTVSLLGCVLSLAFLALLVIPGSPGALSLPATIALLVWISMGVTFYLSRLNIISGITDEQMREAAF